MATLEVCIDSIASLHACIRGTPDRVELCSALALGGLTPSVGLMRLAASTDLPIFAMIRPRAGDFNFNNDEIAVMCDDIAAACNAGLSGVVLGVSNFSRNAGLNVDALEKLVKAAGPMSKTLHRVIDTLDNPLDAMEQAIDLGFDHILTSGGEPSVENGTSLLTRLYTQAAGRIVIMAGAGLTPSLVQSIHQQTGITSFHSSCTRKVDDTESHDTLGFCNEAIRTTDADIICQYKLALKQL